MEPLTMRIEVTIFDSLMNRLGYVEYSIIGDDWAIAETRLAAVIGQMQQAALLKARATLKDLDEFNKANQEYIARQGTLGPDE